VLFGIFLAGRVYVLVTRDADGQLDESQQASAVLSGITLSLMIFFVIAGVMALIGMRVNGRIRALTQTESDGVVINTYRRWDPSFYPALLELGLSKIDGVGVFTLVADSVGIAFFGRYSPPDRVLFIPWSDVVDVATGEFVVGVRSVARINVIVRVESGEVVLPIVPSQSGWAVYSFGEQVRTRELVMTLEDLRSGRKTPVGD